MANWNGLQLTNKGIALQAKVQAGTELEITKLKLGSGVVPSGTDIKTLTDLITPEQNLGIGGTEAVGDYCKVSATISNSGLKAGYYVCELGVFAQDPDEGEILYMYATDGAPDYLPAGGGSTVISQEFSVMIAVDDTDNIVVDIDSAALATMGYVQLQIQQHDNNVDAHEAAFNAHNADGNAHKDMVGATSGVAGKRGMVPAPAAGTANRYLKADGTWGTIDTMNGASSSAAGSAGLVPAPGAGAANRYLRSDGSWQVPPDTKYSNMKGATSSAAGVAGLVPAPAAGENDEFLRGDGTWQPINTMKGASSSAAGSSGLVPAPAAGDQNKALFGDATYKQVVQSINGVVADNEGDVSLRNALYCHDASEFMEELGTAGWNSKGVYAVTFSNTQNFPQKPSNSYFALFNLAETSNNGYAIQMLLNVINGDLYTRGTNNQAELDEVPFKRLAFYSEVLAALPVGTILPFAGSSIPTGFLACNGAGVRATTYANLYAVIGNTYGGDSTTFNLPQIEDNRFLEFSSARGTKHNAGLPNITGSYPRCPHEENLYQGPTGAFGMAGPSPEIPGTSSESSNTRGLSFDASRSNSIYGGSTTVQPKSLTVRAIIKY